jgi:hypothetical protein
MQVIPSATMAMIAAATRRVARERRSGGGLEFM